MLYSAFENVSLKVVFYDVQYVVLFMFYSFNETILSTNYIPGIQVQGDKIKNNNNKKKTLIITEAYEVCYKEIWIRIQDAKNKDSISHFQKHEMRMIQHLLWKGIEQVSFLICHQDEFWQIVMKVSVD